MTGNTHPEPAPAPLPILTKWILKLDDVYAMPQLIQGIVLGTVKGFKSGSQVVLRNIVELDLSNNKVKLQSGEEFNLVGEGSQMVLLPAGGNYGIVKFTDPDPDDENFM